MSNTGIQILKLVDGCCKNDRKSQGELYHWLYDYVMKICYRYTNHRQEAEELTSESFVKLFKNLRLFGAGRQLNTEALFKAWFKRIIIDICTGYLRRHPDMADGPSPGADNGVTENVHETAARELSNEEIIEAIKQLTPVYRTLYNLFAIEGLSHEEIAMQLHINIGVSTANLAKARQNLQKIIAQHARYGARVPTECQKC